LPAILRLRHYFKIFLQTEQFAEPIPKDGVIVGYDNSNFRPRW
jgi:hypothetical protein